MRETDNEHTQSVDAERRPYDPPTVVRFGTFAELTLQIYGKCKA